MFAPITKYSVLLEKPEDARYIFEKAVHISKSGRPGPVVIDLPHNVQHALVVPLELRGYTPPAEEARQQDAKANAKLILDKIRKAKKPLLLVGGGVRIAGTADDAHAFAEKSGLLVVTTWTSADIFPCEFPRYLGNVGKSGDIAAVNAVQDCDLLVCLGTRFTPKVIISEKRFAKNAEIIAVDIDRNELEQGIIEPHVKIVADLRDLLPALIEGICDSPLVSDEWSNELIKRKAVMPFVPELSDKTGKYVNPFNFAEQLFQTMKSDGVVFADTGANLTWIMQGFKLKRGQRLISAWGNSPMGYAFPAAIGAWLAEPDRQIVCTIGDGGFQMNIQELQTMVGNKVDIKVFILNNRCYGNIKMGARRELSLRVHGNDASSGYTVPDFGKVVRAYGIATETIDTEADIALKLPKILATNGAVIVDVNIDPAQEHVELKI
jgi:acetolactate synthase-1/2/3 large subunit